MAEFNRSNNSGPNRGPRGGGGPRRGGRNNDRSNGGPDKDYYEKVMFINRSSKVVKGGRRFAFSALVVIGDNQGGVGLGMGKAGEVADAIRKASQNGKSDLAKLAITDGTIPHQILSIYDGAKVLLKPASPGTGVIAGKTVRAVVEAAGIKNLLTKSLGSNNPTNLAKATLEGLKKLRRREDIYKRRGLSVPERKAAKVETTEAVAAVSEEMPAPVAEAKDQ